MMMKIFGAVLIISGGFFIGKGISVRWSKRLKALNLLREMFAEFDLNLRKDRVSPDEFFLKQGEFGTQILKCNSIDGMNDEDREQLSKHLDCLRKNSYRESIDANEQFLNLLKEKVERIKGETETSGKAVPLITAAAGILMVVILI